MYGSTIEEEGIVIEREKGKGREVWEVEEGKNGASTCSATF